MQDKVAAWGFVDKASLVSFPSTRFEEARLLNLGITDPLSCQVVRDLRMQSTWLGAHLSAMGVNTAGMAAYEKIVFEEFY